MKNYRARSDKELEREANKYIKGIWRNLLIMSINNATINGSRSEKYVRAVDRNVRYKSILEEISREIARRQIARRREHS